MGTRHRGIRDETSEASCAGTAACTHADCAEIGICPLPSAESRSLSSRVGGLSPLSNLMASRLLRLSLRCALGASALALHVTPRVPQVRSMATAPALDVSKYYTAPRPDATKDYVMQQTMLRVKDPAKSLEFYCDVLGFNMVMHREFPQWEFK